MGSFVDGASPYGALDMAGNVWAWCEDADDPRTSFEPHYRFAGGGFRCARSPR